jgi:hypothetical protein
MLCLRLDDGLLVSLDDAVDESLSTVAGDASNFELHCPYSVLPVVFLFTSL